MEHFIYTSHVEKYCISYVSPVSPLQTLHHLLQLTSSDQNLTADPLLNIESLPGFVLGMCWFGSGRVGESIVLILQRA